MNNLTLFEIEKDRQELLDMRDEAMEAGALPAELEAIDKALQEYECREVRKVDGTAHAITVYNQAADIVEAEIKRLQGRAKSLRGRADRIKANALAAMQAFGVKKLETPLHYLRVQGNGGLEPLTVDMEVLPRSYQTVTVRLGAKTWDNFSEGTGLRYNVLDRGIFADTIRDALKRGEVIPGAKLEERGVHLRVE